MIEMVSMASMPVAVVQDRAEGGWLRLEVGSYASWAVLSAGLGQELGMLGRDVLRGLSAELLELLVHLRDDL